MDSPHYSLEDFKPASNGDLSSSQQQRQQREQQQASESALYASDFDLPPNSTRSSATPSASSRQRQNASSRNNSNFPNSQQQQQVSASAIYASDFDLPPSSTRPSASPSANSRQRQNVSTGTNSSLTNSQHPQQVSASALYASDFDLPPNSTRPSAPPSATSRQRQNASNRSASTLANTQQQQVSASALYASDFDLPPNSTRPSAPPSATSRQRQNASNRSASTLANTQQQQVSASALYASDFDLPPSSTRPSASPSATSRQRQHASNRSSRSLAAGGQGRDELKFEDNFEMGSTRDVAVGVGLRSSGSALRRPELSGARRVSESGGDAGRESLDQGGQVENLERNQDTSGRENVFADSVDTAAHVDTVSGALALESQPSNNHVMGSVDFGRGEDDGGMAVAPRVSPPPTWSGPYEQHEQQLEQNEADAPTKSLHYIADTHESSSLARESPAASTAQAGFAELPSAPSEQLQADNITLAVAATDAGTVIERHQQQEQPIRGSSSHLMGDGIAPPPGVRWNFDTGSRTGEVVVKKKPRARVVAKAAAKQVTISLPSPTPSPPPLSARKRPGYRDRIRAAHASVPSHFTHPRAPYHSSSSSPATGGASATAAAGGGSDTPPTRATRREKTLQEQADLEADRQRVQAIVDLLERKRAEFREQKRVEVEEHAARARARREHLDARHERAQAEAAELTRTTLAAYHKLYPRTDPLTHRNIIPADWTSTLWYREAVEQAHHRLPDTRNKPHPHCTAKLPTKLGRGVSSDVVFGRLLTPGVRAFRAQEEGEQEDDDYDDYDMAFARHAPITTLPPIPIPSMPSLDLSIRLSGESEELYETAELGKKHEPATAKYHHQFTRMSENIVRNKETVTKLLAHKPPLFGTSFASVATPDDDGYGDGTGGVDGGLKLSVHDLAEGGGADALFADRGYEIHVRRVGTSGGGGGGVEAEQQQAEATAAVELPAGGSTQSALPTHMQLSSAGILRSATTGFTVQAAEQLTRDIVSGSRRGSVAVRELLTAPVAPSPASIASALATNWQRRPSSVHAKPILEEAATTASQTAADIAGPAETLHEESEPDDGGDEQKEGNATPLDDDDDGDGADAAQARSRSRSASTSRSRARSSSAAVSASSSSQNDDEDDDDSQQGFDESDEESTSRLFDTSRARTPFSHHKASSSMQSSAFSRRLTSASTQRSVASTRTGSANLDSRASSLARRRSASSGGFSSAGSVASGNGDGEQQQHHHHRRGRRRQREVSKLAAAAGPTTATTSPTREQDAADGSNTKPRKHTLMPLTLDEVIAWEGLKIMQPVVRIKRKMWTVV
ncbi:hypothetical protein HDU88_003470 [Geranomyces variabilis]|nr:hypothetical protein HDU88_003470 [Geranomyces variabilis]